MENVTLRNVYVADMIPLERVWLKPKSASKQDSIYLLEPMKTIKFQTDFVSDSRLCN